MHTGWVIIIDPEPGNLAIFTIESPALWKGHWLLEKMAKATPLWMQGTKYFDGSMAHFVISQTWVNAVGIKKKTSYFVVNDCM